MWGMFKRYDRWHDVAGHLIGAQRELLAAMAELMGAMAEAAAPFAKEDPLASLLHEVFRFFERGARVLMPVAPSASHKETIRQTQRHAMLAIRAVLLEERAQITPHADVANFRAEVIDSILRVLDGELERLDLGLDSAEEENFVSDTAEENQTNPAHSSHVDAMTS